MERTRFLDGGSLYNGCVNSSCVNNCGVLNNSLNGLSLFNNSLSSSLGLCASAREERYTKNDCK